MEASDVLPLSFFACPFLPLPGENGKEDEMEYRVFADRVAEKLSREMGESYEVRLTDVVKNNRVTLLGVVILGEQENVSPTIYLEHFYEQYQNGEDLDGIVRKILDIYRTKAVPVHLDMDFFQDYEKVKKKIYHRLVHYRMNEEQLAAQPHIRWNDLAITFYYAMEEKTLGKATITITNQHLEMWGIDKEELYRTAQENMRDSRPELLVSMKDLLEEMMREQLSEQYQVPMYVLTNQEKMYGASALLYSEKIGELADKLHSDLLILPSSVHEVLLIPDGKEQDYEFFRNMVGEVNSSQVEPEEVLSGSLYRYVRDHEKIEEIVS